VGSVIIDVSMSIDGFVAGPNDSEGVPLGENGERCTNGCSTRTGSALVTPGSWRS
jgi:hypothetical protein